MNPVNPRFVRATKLTAESDQKSEFLETCSTRTAAANERQSQDTKNLET